MTKRLISQNCKLTSVCHFIPQYFQDPERSLHKCFFFNMCTQRQLDDCTQVVAGPHISIAVALWHLVPDVLHEFQIRLQATMLVMLSLIIASMKVFATYQTHRDNPRNAAETGLLAQLSDLLSCPTKNFILVL